MRAGSEGADQAHLFFVGLGEVSGKQSLGPVIFLLQGPIQAAVCPPVASRGRGQQAAFAFETQGESFGREFLEQLAHCRAAGGEQCHLVGLQVAKGCAQCLFG
ncbi:hypothetical protein D3C81_1738340 [compost metagenome]